MSAFDEDSGLKEQIRHHATRLFAQRGFAGTSMRELVEACECTKAACYYYFSSKEALYRDVVRFHAERIKGLVVETVKSAGSVRERLHAGLDQMIDYSVADPVAMQLMQRIDLTPEDNAPLLEDTPSRVTHLCLITELVTEGTANGELRSDIDLAEGALVLTGAMQFQFDAAIASGEWNRKRMHRTIDLILDGISNHD
ncbi:MAG: TetR/AcrR family transcriptional regulator [Myxococcales bacterium]|nr:TetR/AcrR family transcriptional regulator [Myxococcales bacterium]